MISTPPTLAGLFFCLASTRCGAFIFAMLQYSHEQAFTACFASSMQLYRKHSKAMHRALQWLFLRLCQFNRPRYQTDTSGYNTACATLERAHAPGRPAPIPDTSATSDAVQVNAAAYYNNVYKGAKVRRCYGSMPDDATDCRPCKPSGVCACRLWIAGKC